MTWASRSTAVGIIYHMSDCNRWESTQLVTLRACLPTHVSTGSPSGVSGRLSSIRQALRRGCRREGGSFATLRRGTATDFAWAQSHQASGVPRPRLDLSCITVLCCFGCKIVRFLLLLRFCGGFSPSNDIFEMSFGTPPTGPFRPQVRTVPQTNFTGTYKGWTPGERGMSFGYCTNHHLKNT